MPNDCINRITLYADAETISKIASTGYQLLDLLPPLDVSGGDNITRRKRMIEEFGTDRFYDYECVKVGREAILFRFTTAWLPPNGFLSKLVHQYPSITFLKSDWDVEDGIAGIWVAERSSNGVLKIQSMEWDEGCLEEKVHRFDGGSRST